MKKIIILIVACFAVFGCVELNLNYDKTFSLYVNNKSLDTIWIKRVDIHIASYNIITDTEPKCILPESNNVLLGWVWKNQKHTNDLVLVEDCFKLFSSEGACMELYDRSGTLLRRWKSEDAAIESDNIFSINNWKINHSTTTIKGFFGERLGENHYYTGDFDITPEMLGLKE